MSEKYIKTQPNHAAFPWNDGEGNGGFGISVRAYFAAIALQGIAITAEVNKQTSKQTAEESVRLADALIAALNK